MSSRLSLPRKKANEVLSSLQIESPSTLRYLKEICCERGAFVRESQLSGSEGRLVVNGDRGIITIHPHPRYQGRNRFSVAHELGHFELHRNEKTLWSCTDADMNRWNLDARAEKREIEANEFAAELLMPEKFIAPDIDRDTPNLELLKAIANEYHVSLTALLHRFTDLTQRACAIVFTKGGRISHSWKSKQFRKAKLWVPAGEVDAKVFEQRTMAEAEAKLWIEPSPKQNGPKPDLSGTVVFQQSEFFKNIGLGVTLLWLPQTGQTAK